MGKDSHTVRPGFAYFILATLLFATQLAFYIKGSAVLPSMDAGGWAFFITSCLSHGACIALPLFLVLYLPVALLRRPRTAGVIMAICVALVSMLIFLNMQVYDIYRFHINGFVINLITSGSGDQIFTFDSKLYLREGLILAIFAAIAGGLWPVARRLQSLFTTRVIIICVALLVADTLFAHLYHIRAAFMQQSSVLKSRRLIPYYFPTTANSLMEKFGYIPPQTPDGVDALGDTSGEILYPLNPIISEPLENKPNILIILIDSWSKRAFEPQTMPEAWKFASGATVYDNHFSSSNGTRGSVFGIYFSVPAYYWDLFEGAKANPVFIDEMLRQGYRCQIYPGASLIGPPFFRVVFRNIPDLNIETEGHSVYDRDRQLTDNFIADLHKDAAGSRPFFSMLFYDLPHSFELSEDKLIFKPTWKYADYTRLNNDLDPTEFFNLYRSTCRQVDMMLADVFAALEREGVADNTIVILSGDHGQEFNENHKNYWSHGGNFSRWQIGVPLIVKWPGEPGGATRSWRTTHYDIVPTLMTRALGVTNPIADYSVGKLLSDSTARDWHVVGSNINYGFILRGDTILEKPPAGGLDVTDAQLNPVDGYRLDSKGFNDAMRRLNSFMK